MNIEDIDSPLPSREPKGDLGTENKQADNLTPEPKTEAAANEPVQPQAEIEIKPKKIPVLPIIGGIVALLLLTAGLFWFKSRDTAGGVTTINYWGLWEDSSVIEGVIADFEEKNPNIKINYTKNIIANYRTKLKGRLAKDAEQIEVPDIYRIHSTWIPSFREDLASVPSMTANNLKLEDDFFEIYKQNLKEGGEWKAVPLMYDGLALFYNKDLVESAQVSLPKTWWGLESIANKLTVKDEMGRIKIAGVALGTTNNVDHWSDIVGLMMAQNGVDPLKNDEINNRKLQDVLTYYSLFKTKQGVWDETLPDSTAYFANGKLGFYFGPSWRIFNIQDMNPYLNFEVMRVPQLPTLEGVSPDEVEYGEGTDNITNIHWASYWVEGVNLKSKKQKEAWKFLEYLASAEGLEKMYQTASQTRSFGEIYPRKSLAAKLTANSKIKNFVESADSAMNWYLCSRTFDDGVNDEMSKYFEDAIGGIVINSARPEDVMPNLRNGIDQLIQKYQLKR